VFLTGGSGLIGSHVAALLRDEGHEVTALCRADTDVSHLESLGCVIAPGDVRDPPAALAAVMGGCTHVVHGAALVYAGGSWPKVRSVNVEGTANVLEAAAHAGARHAVHISSVAVYGSVLGPVDERHSTAGPLPPKDLYARSKREAEAEVRRVEKEHGLSVTVLRPSAVYGERDRLMAQRIARMVRGPVAFLLGRGDNTIPAVYAGNVAVAVSLALASGRGGETFDVGMDHPLTQRALLRGLARGMGRSPRLISIPAGLARTVAAVLERLGVSTPGVRSLPLGRVVRLALGDNPYPSRRIRDELGWAPPHEHEEALARTGRWLKDFGSSTERAV
ncbi:MAG TPA: NAD-dependent epimerase/dehydratase family protein, partial [Longimicrobiales bacterium]|nr:NAD-dependent epimerase/dehydratase family protein [Longimicrobiales bacterium]